MSYETAYPPIKDEDLIISAVDVLQELLNLRQVLGFDCVLVFEGRWRKGGRVSLYLKSVGVQRISMGAISDIHKGLLLGLKFEVRRPLVYCILIDGDKKLEGLLLPVKGEPLEVVDLGGHSATSHSCGFVDALP